MVRILTHQEHDDRQRNQDQATVLALHKDGRPHEEDQRDENGKDSGNEEIRTMVMAGSPARTRNNSDWGQDGIITPSELRCLEALHRYHVRSLQPCKGAERRNRYSGRAPFLRLLTVAI